MKTIKLLFVIIAMIANYTLTAQVAVTNDGSSADGSAMLEVKSTTKGLLPPRMTAAQIGAVVSPADGLTVYNTDDGKLYIYVLADNKWKEVAFGAGTIAGPFMCGESFVDTRDSKNYTTVQIGTQCWMAENLAYLPSVNPTSNTSEIDPINYVYAYEGTNVTEAKATANYQTYGVLYNFPSALVSCPDGWHLPTIDEFSAMRSYVSSQPEYLCDGISINKSLAATTNWNSSSIACATGNDISTNNATGFNAQPAGTMTGGSFDLVNSQANFYVQPNYTNYIYYSYTVVGGFGASGANAHSVRCLKD